MRFSSSSSLLLALLGSSAPALVPAARIWSSDGSRASWDDSYIDAGTAGKVTEVDNVYYGTAPALKMEQRYQASYGGLYHAEVHHYEGYKRGDKLSYGFEFRLQSDWDFTPGVSFNLAQFIADFTDLGCEETWMPSTMVYLYGNQLTTRVKYGNVCPTDQQKITTFGNLATVTAGVWHKVVLEVSWKSDGTGTFNLWFDGRQAAGMPKTGIPTTVTQAREFQFRVGLYANGWKKGMSVAQPFRQVWFDRIAIGDAPADVDPDNW
ncbi:putative glucuronan lyase a protein [Eutypa lata UCREL1]|uniref:Putative glucuronan lyase a protein n=1 Tax=Eutypa lata (strain UCR-EL1) TaxID=1287681 RepID=M7SGZ7_EUTLA|nr:putative glucuronan lyase a protein [Eutypa lata UCREL1]